MKYLCLGYYGEDALRTLRAGGAVMAETAAYNDELRRGGHILDATMLDGGRAAATLRFEAGKVAVTDGPFAETKEQLAGAVVLEATDLNHAIQLMSQMPCMRHVGGCMEIRPIHEQAFNEDKR